MPAFSRTQQGVILLLGAVLLVVLGWRVNFGRAFAAPPAAPVKWFFVEVEGPAAHPGVMAFDHSPNLPEVLRRAGRPQPASVPESRLTSGTRVIVRPDGGHLLGLMQGARLLMLGLALNLNSASKEDLEALPGIGPALAARILEYRKNHGPFKKVEDLEQVSGIGPKKMEKLRPLVIVDSQERPTGED